MRNFYIVGEVDGRSNAISTGPRPVEGGMVFTVFQMDQGESVEVLRIVCEADGNSLSTIVLDGEDNFISRIETKRK